MSAYLIAEITIHNPDEYEQYKTMVQPTLEQYGGRYLARGGNVEILEGMREPRRSVLIKFPDAGSARAWWSSEEYAEAKRIRQAAADTDMLLLEGL